MRIVVADLFRGDAAPGRTAFGDRPYDNGIRADADVIGYSYVSYDLRARGNKDVVPDPRSETASVCRADIDALVDAAILTDGSLRAYNDRAVMRDRQALRENSRGDGESELHRKPFEGDPVEDYRKDK